MSTNKPIFVLVVLKKSIASEIFIRNISVETCVMNMQARTGSAACIRKVICACIADDRFSYTSECCNQQGCKEVFVFGEVYTVYAVV